MNEIIIIAIISGLAFLLFVATLTLGWTKKNKQLKLTSLLIFFVFSGLAIWTGYLVVSKTYDKVADSFKMRTGDEIYKAIFDNRKADCVKILNHQDQVVPKIDYAIWLHFETCPSELKRILNPQNFSSNIVSTKGWNSEGPLAHENWFKPETLGDSIIVNINIDENGNGQYIYTNLDSTEVFVKDIID